jgi:hypothetical protein
MPQPSPTITPVTRRRARRLHDTALRTHAWLQHRWALLTADPESGMDDIPWKMILMIGGGVIAVGMVTAIVAFVHAQLAQLPTNPGF